MADYEVLHQVETGKMRLELREFETPNGFRFDFVNVGDPDPNYQSNHSSYEARLIDGHYLLGRKLLGEEIHPPYNITDTKEELESKVLQRVDAEIVKIKKWEQNGGIPPPSWYYARGKRKSEDIQAGRDLD